MKKAYLISAALGAALTLATPSAWASSADGISSDGETVAAPKSQNPADLKKILAEKLPGWLAEYDVPSAAIAYIADGNVAWTHVAGEAEPGKVATADTLYNIASMTKPLVAETLVRLAEGGAFTLDESMASSWVDPDIKSDPRHKLLTPRMALVHRTGFTNWRYQTKDVLTFKNDPGTQFGYSGEGFQYMARFAEKKMGAPLETLVAQQIFEPAGMTQTSFTEKPWFAGRIAMSRNGKGEHAHATVRKDWNAADDVWSTAGDYARFLTWMMANPVSDQPTETYWTAKENLSRQICGEGRLAAEVCPKILGFVGGWNVYHTADNVIVMHGGGDVGERTLGFFDPVNKTGAVIFTNGAKGQKVIRDVVKTLYPDPSLDAFMNMQAGG
ncbi:MAG: serine hydrolase domain-containing protein [Parasphingorhabdus sp.]|uniref:serine hydrolase domain-containing protein n=1 Tax=Parasphingorhabdus sp. TaxID=2709688 RepID=UPI0032986A10